MTFPSVEEIARALAYEEWPLATEAERNLWRSEHWPDYVSKAKAVLVLFPAPPAGDEVEAVVAAMRAEGIASLPTLARAAIRALHKPEEDGLLKEALSALSALVASLADQDDEGLIEHAPQMQAAQAVLSRARTHNGEEA